jgi:hypothetical protein
MSVRMRMRFDNRPVVLVHVMLVVPVQVVMLENLVRVNVTVSLTNEQENTGSHENRPN